VGADETLRVFEEQSLTLITAGLSALTIIVRFAVFDAVRQTLTFDRRPVFSGYRQTTIVLAKTLTVTMLGMSTALYTGRPRGRPTNLRYGHPGRRGAYGTVTGTPAPTTCHD
jgi:hypothetical protein